MKKLSELVEVVTNNGACVVLKVKDNVEFELISLGCFDGDEKMIRLTKGKDITCTVFNKNDSNFSWHWGYSGYTLVSDNMEKMGRMIQSTIENDFGIKVKY